MLRISVVSLRRTSSKVLAATCKKTKRKKRARSSGGVGDRTAVDSIAVAVVAAERILQDNYSMTCPRVTTEGYVR